MSISRLATLAGASLLVTGCAGLLPTQPGASSSSQVGSPTGTVSSQGSRDSVGVLSNVQELRVEVRELRDRVERQEFELERLQRRQRDLYDDLDQRLRAQERGGSSASGQLSSSGVSSQTPGTQSPSVLSVPTIGASSAAQDPAQSGTPGRVGESVQSGIVRGGLESQTPTVGGGSSAQTGSSVGETAAPGQVAIVQPEIGGGTVSLSAQEAYDQAFSLLKQSRYADAIQAFEAFNRDYPPNDLTDDAYYWLAEARYVTREFEAALNGFRTVTANFPNSQRVPASYLKIGYIQYEIAAYADARETLTYIMKNFPTHRVAVSAETRLRKMDREGR